MEQAICQSCGMPLSEDVLGSNADGSKNEEYCMYCMKEGNFTADCTMEEMIDFCVKPMMEEKPEKSETEIRNMIASYMPLLKRWKK